MADPSNPNPPGPKPDGTEAHVVRAPANPGSGTAALKTLQSSLLIGAETVQTLGRDAATRAGKAVGREVRAVKDAVRSLIR